METNLLLYMNSPMSTAYFSKNSKSMPHKCHHSAYAPNTTMLSITLASSLPTLFIMHTHHLLQFTNPIITVFPPSQLDMLSLPTTLICRYTKSVHYNPVSPIAIPTHTCNLADCVIFLMSVITSRLYTPWRSKGTNVCSLAPCNRHSVSQTHPFADALSKPFPFLL